MTIVPVCRCGHTFAAHVETPEGDLCQLCDCKRFRHNRRARDRRRW